MKELNEAAEKAQALFGINESTSIPGNWAKWYHDGIPDEPEDERDKARKFAAIQGHCKECTGLSGCFFIDGPKTFPTYPHHPNCHCEKQDTSPNSVIADCDIRKFTGYIFADKYAFNGKRVLFRDNFGYTIEDSPDLKAEYERQAKEKYKSGDYILNELGQYGQFININIELESPKHGIVNVISGWQVHPNGLITCNTPLGDD